MLVRLSFIKSAIEYGDFNDRGTHLQQGRGSVLYTAVSRSEETPPSLCYALCASLSVHLRSGEPYLPRLLSD